MAFSPDGRRIVSGSADQTVRVWDAESGEQIAQLECTDRFRSFVECVAFSPDGKRIVAGSGDSNVRVWNAESGEQIAQLEGHTKGVTGAAFLRDGRCIISSSADNTVRVWDAECGECLEIIERTDNIRTDDIKAAATGPASYPYRLIRHELETVVETAACGEPIGRFPITLFEITIHPSGRKWASANANQLYILELVGDAATPENRSS